MKTELEEYLLRVGEETFESMAYIMPADPLGGEAVGSGTRIWVSVFFAGPFNGCLYLGASATLLPTLAANMMGLVDDEAPPLQLQQDALKELANVVCGNLLPALAGPDAIFEVQAPHLLGEILIEDRQFRPAGRVRMFTEAGEAELALCLAKNCTLRIPA